MSNVMTRNFESVFSLDKSKLSRLLNVIEERFKGLSETVITHFEVSTQRGKTYSSSNIEEILSHDNPIKNPIMDLSITYKDKSEDPENSCFIKYEKEDNEIRVKVQSIDAKKCNELFAEIEEQIERSLVKNWVYSIKNQAPHEFMMMITLLVMIPLMMLLLFKVIPDASSPTRASDFMSSEDIAYFQDAAENVNSTEDKIDALLEYQVRRANNLSKSRSDSGGLSIDDFLSIRWLLILLPVLVALGGLYYIISKTYIGSVFLWGDYVDYYNSLLDRRKFLWSTVVIALVVGILGNLFVFGFSQYL